MTDRVFTYDGKIEYEKEPIFAGDQVETVEWLKQNYSGTNSTYFVRVGETLRLMAASMYLALAEMETTSR